MMKYIKKHINSLIIIAILIVVNGISSRVFKRFDLTEEKRYSVSEPTKAFLKDLDDVVTVRVYLTGNLPSGMKELEKNIETTLSEFKAYAGNQLEYEFVDLSKYDKKTQEEEGKILMSKGLMPINLTVVESGEQTQRVIFPGAIISYKNRLLSTNLLENKLGFDQYQILNNSIVLLEYKLANAIQKLQQNTPPIVAFSNGHGELKQEQLTDVITALQDQQFAVSTINLKESFRIDEMVDVLVIAQPKEPFSEKEKYKIDQYLMRGGHILFFIDQMAVSMDSLQGSDFFMANPRDLNLVDMLFQYGARVNDDLVLDLQSGKLQIQTGLINNQPQLQWFNWPYYNLMFGNNEHPVTRNLAPVLGNFTSTIDTIKNSKIKKEILLTTSDFSKATYAPARVFVGLVKENLEPSYFPQKNLSTAVALSGQFESIFKNRAFTGAYAAMADTVESLQFKETSDEQAKVIIVSDGDMIANSYKKGSKLELGYTVFGNNNEGIVFDNKPFFLNCVEYLIDKNNLIETRSKEIKLRQLDLTKVKDKKQSIQLYSVILPIVIILLFGIIYSWLRRKKYAS